MSEKSLKKNAAYNILRNICSILFPLISFPYASRILLPEGIGNINFANSIIDIFLLISGLGIASYAIREGAVIRNNKSAINKLAREMLIINLISMLFSAGLFLISLFCVPKFSSIKILLLITSTKILFESTSMLWVLTVYEDYKAITLRSIFFQFLSIVLLFVLVRTKDDLWKYAIIGIIFSAGSCFFGIIYTRKYINIFERTKIELFKHYKGILIFFGVAVSAKIYTLIDSSMLGFLCKPEQVGYYTAANKITNIVVTLITSIVGVFLPRCTNYIHNKKYIQYYRICSDGFNTTIFIGIPASFGIFVLCRNLVILFSGNNFLPAVPSMQLLSTQLVSCTIISALQSLILIPKNKEKVILYAQIFTCIVNCALNYILISNFQAVGAALATLLSQFVLMLWFVIYCYKFLFRKEIIINFIQCVAASFAMFFIVGFIQTLPVPVLLNVFISVITGVLSYALITLGLKNKIALMLYKMIIKKLCLKRIK